MSEPRDTRLTAEQLALKAATRELVSACGGQDGAAATLATRQQRVSDCSSRNMETFLRIDEIARLEDHSPDTANWPQVTRALAHRQGFDLVRRPAATATALDIHKAMGALSRETSQVIEGLCAALASGGISRSEALLLRGEIPDAQRKLAELDAMLAKAAEDTS